MRVPQAEGLSERTRTVLTEMLNSGDALLESVAATLDEVAFSGEGRETDEFLGNYAYAMSDAASDAGYWIRHGKQDDQPSEGMGPADVQTIQDILELADVEVAIEEITTWTAEQRQGAVDWAGALHLQASDNDVDVPPCPFVVPPDATAVRLVNRMQRDGHRWHVWGTGVVGRQPIGSIPLPSFFDREMAMRFAYKTFKARLRAANDWSVE